MFALLYLASSVFAAFELLMHFQPPLRFLEIVFLSIPAGFAFATYYGWLFASSSGSFSYTVNVSCTVHMGVICVVLLPSTMYFVRKRSVLWRSEIGNTLSLWVYVGPLMALYSVLINSRALSEQRDSVRSGGATWADMAIHLAISNSFVHGQNRVLSFDSMPWSPIFQGEKLVYGFFPDYHLATLVSLGASERFAIMIPQALLVLSFLCLMYLFALRLTNGDGFASGLSVWLIIFSGGVGFFYWYEGGMEMKHLDWVEKVSHTGIDNLYWFAAIPHILLPQRAACYAFPLALGSLIMVFEGLNTAASLGTRMKLMAGAAYKTDPYKAVCCCLTPMLQTHAFVAINVLLLVVSLTSRKELRDPRFLLPWILYGMIVAVFGLPQMLVFFGRATGEGSTEKFISIQNLWVDDHHLQTILSRVLGVSVKHPLGMLLLPITFWIRALSLMVPLAILGTLLVMRCERQLRFCVGAWTVFFMCSFIRFQPWKFDNIKMFYIWLMCAAPMTALFLSTMRKKTIFAWLLIIPIIISLTASGYLAVTAEFNSNHEFYGSPEKEVGEWLKNNTGARAPVICSDRHISPVNVIAGRTQVAGFPGWLSSHGYPSWYWRKEQLKRVFSGEDDAISVMRSFNSSYVLIDHDIRTGQLGHFNLNFFNEKMSKVFDNEVYQVYHLKRERTPAADVAELQQENERLQQELSQTQFDCDRTRDRNLALEAELRHFVKLHGDGYESVEYEVHGEVPSQ